MIRHFIYGFLCGFVFNYIGVIMVGLDNAFSNFSTKEEQKISSIGSLIGFLCSCIAIGWLVYCFKF